MSDEKLIGGKPAAPKFEKHPLTPNEVRVTAVFLIIKFGYE